MDEYISKQAILKYIEKTRQGALMMDDIRRASRIMHDMHLFEEVIKNQTSVQPEIIHCGNCKHRSDEKPGMVYCPEIIGEWVKNDCFCAMWECKR